MAQTTITTDPGDGQAGQLATSADYQITSKRAEGAVAVGLVVVQGTTEDECKVPGVTGDVSDGGVLGVSRLVPTRESADYADNEYVEIVQEGEVYVLVNTTDSVAGDPVYVVHADGTIRGTADASATVLPNAVFKTSTVAGNVGVVKLGGVHV